MQKLGHMAHLAARPCFRLAVEMHETVFFRQPCRYIVDVVADEVGHDAIRMAIRAAGSKTRYGTDMLFELRDYAGRLRPAGVPTVAQVNGQRTGAVRPGTHAGP